MKNSANGACKIIISGPVGAGKSTAIGTLSDIPVVVTKELATDETKGMKQGATEAMDYGILKIPHGEVVHLYGTRGQERFDYMREALAEGVLGLILLISNADADPFQSLDGFLKAYENLISRTAVAVGITYMDKAPMPGIADYQKYMIDHDLKYPIFQVDARNIKDLQVLLQALLYSIE